MRHRSPNFQHTDAWRAQLSTTSYTYIPPSDDIEETLWDSRRDCRKPFGSRTAVASPKGQQEGCEDHRLPRPHTPREDHIMTRTPHPRLRGPSSPSLMLSIPSKQEAHSTGPNTIHPRCFL
ncbi:unnamed protein product [Gadus morhua 'NCC']